MGALNQILASLDHARRKAGRNVRDLTTNPRGYLEMLSDRLSNFNRGEVAEVNPRTAGMRKLSKQERTKQMTEAVLEGLGQGGMGALGVIKQRGGNWLPPGLPHRVNPAEALSPHLRISDLTMEDLSKLPGVTDEAINNARVMDNWVKGPLQKYIMRDMATPEDPIRRLADQGILHVDPQELNFNMSTYGKWPFDNQQFMAKSDPAKAWEGVSDNAISTNHRVYLAPEPRSSKLSREHPWVDKLPEDTPLYGLNEPEHFIEDVGFDRLIQSVYDDLTEGRLRPEQLSSGSFNVEAAVRLAHQKRMAKLAAKEAEDLKRSRNAAVFTHKEYPDNNPEGFHWAEIRDPNPEHPSEQTWGDLQRALNYEGDLMGHCVGDYCDSVMAGNTRIFSLRDAKGKPHVTIEARKGQFLKNLKEDPTWSIQQVKGSGKKDPTQAILKEDLPKYQPYLIDFLNSQSWGTVRDLKNTGLIDAHSMYGPDVSQFRFLTPEQQAQLYESNPQLKSKMGQALDDPNFNDGWEPDEHIEFAQGGLVRPRLGV